MEVKTILAGDLSLACPAFAVMQVNVTTGELNVLHLSHIKTSSKKSTGYRLFEIAKHLELILMEFPIDEIVIEKGFSRFPTATQQIQRVVGVFTVIVFHRYREKDIHEIAVTSVKKAVTGKGKADKSEVAEALEKYVGPIKYATDDESDSIAVGITFMKQKGWLI